MNLKINNKITGINLVSLIIGSALGAFLLTVIVKISISINNNHQFIKANLELTISARQLTNFFTQVFMANGYIEQPFSANPSVTNPSIINQNFFGINTSGGANEETRFYLWYSPGISNALSCSGQPLTTSPSNNPATWLRISFNPSNTNRPASCNDVTVGGGNLIPIVSPQQFNSFYLVATAHLSTALGSNISNISINTSLPSTPTTYGKARGIKLAIILRSPKPVFNTDRPTSFNVFNNIFSITDKHLYKLVIIQSPFIYPVTIRDTGTNDNFLKTQKCNFTSTTCAFGNITDNQK